MLATVELPSVAEVEELTSDGLEPVSKLEVELVDAIGGEDMLDVVVLVGDESTTLELDIELVDVVKGMEGGEVDKVLEGAIAVELVVEELVMK